MTYHFSKVLPIPFDQAISKVTEALKHEGFGILTEIDVRETMKKKLEVDFRNYKILGACNPSLAYQALQAEDKIGTMLPCNVVVQQHSESEVEVSAVDPVASMQAIENPQLATVAEQVRSKLKAIIDSL
ncbi:MAG: DUF302 domain-containing protein [Kovacikia sp.]